MSSPSVTLVVEGDTDVPFAEKILGAAGLQTHTTIDSGGKPRLDKALPSYNAAARGSPWFVLRDLDSDAPCAPELLARLLPKPSTLMCFRVPVRAIEAWVLGDAEGLAKFLKVPETQVPAAPEEHPDPKRLLVSLAGRSTSSAIRRAFTPVSGARRKAGPGYEAYLIEFGLEHWRWQEAQKHCPSLKRCITSLRTLRARLGKANFG